MKRYFLPLLFLLFSVSAFSQSDVKVFTQEGERFFLIVEGERRNETAQTSVTIEGFRSAAIKIKALFEDKTLGSADMTIPFPIEPYNAYSFNVRQNKKGKYVVRILSVTPMDQPAPPPVIVQRAAPPVQTTRTTTTTTGVAVNENISMDVNMTGMNVSMNSSLPGMGVSQTESVTTTTTTGHAQPAARTNYVPGYTGPILCPTPMDQYKFDNIKRGIKSTASSFEKVDKIKSYMSGKCMTASQAETIVGMFSHGSDQLDVAKFLYSHTYDVGNYHIVGSAFTFSSHRRELDDYIAGQQ